MENPFASNVRIIPDAALFIKKSKIIFISSINLIFSCSGPKD